MNRLRDALNSNTFINNDLGALYSPPQARFFCCFRASLWRFVRQKQALKTVFGGFHPSKYCRKWCFLKVLLKKYQKFRPSAAVFGLNPPFLRIGANKGGV